MGGSSSSAPSSTRTPARPFQGSTDRPEGRTGNRLLRVLRCPGGAGHGTQLRCFLDGGRQVWGTYAGSTNSLSIREFLLLPGASADGWPCLARLSFGEAADWYRGTSHGGASGASSAQGSSICDQNNFLFSSRSLLFTEVSVDRTLIYHLYVRILRRFLRVVGRLVVALDRPAVLLGLDNNIIYAYTSIN